MSNKNSVIYCPKCGEANHGVTHFCFSCGTRLVNYSADDIDEKNHILVPPIEKSEEVDQTVVNTPLVTTNSNTSTEKRGGVAERTIISKQNSAKAKFLKTRACAFFLFVVSFIMMIASFLPMIRMNVAYNDRSSFSVSLSPSDILSIGIGSAIITLDEKYTEEYLNYSALESEMQKIRFDANLQDHQIATLKEYTKSALKLHTMSNAGSLKVSFVIAGIATIAYMLATVMAFIFSFVLLAFYKGGDSPKMDGFFESVQSMIAIIVALLPAYIILLLQAAHFSRGFGINDFANNGVEVAWYGKILIIFVILNIAFMCFKGLLRTVNKNSLSRDNTLINRGMSLLCIFLAMLAVFLPFAKIQLATASNGEVAIESFSIYANNFYELSSVDANYFEGMADGYSKSDIIMHIDSVMNGLSADDSIGTDIFNRIAFRYNVQIEYLYTAIGIFSLLVALILAIFLVAVMRLALSNQMIKRKKSLMAFSVIFTLVYLALSIFITISCNSNVNGDVAKYAYISVGVGPILSSLLTIIAVVLLCVRGKIEKPREYDNPDVSYAPYII